jgi:alpha/beta superfamily hydrolase
MREEHRESIVLENNGEKIFAVLHSPLDDSPAPAVLICPGFGGTKCGNLRIFVTLAKELAKQGIAVLRFDYRGAGDSEGEFSDITLENNVSDTLKCIEFLQNHPKIDKTALGILGRSLGGVIGILAARRSKAIASLALWAPVFSSDPWRPLWDSFKMNPLQQIKKEALKHLPVHVPNLEFLYQFFNFNLTHELEELKHVPLLHIHGVNDQIVKLEQAQAYEFARKDVVNSCFIQLNKSDHDFTDEEEQHLVIQKTCEWYQQTLVGVNHELSKSVAAS